MVTASGGGGGGDGDGGGGDGGGGGRPVGPKQTVSNPGAARGGSAPGGSVGWQR